MRQLLDVLGHVDQKGGNTTENVTGLKLCSFHTITLHLSAVCHSETTYLEPKLNPGKYQSHETQKTTEYHQTWP